MSDMHDDVYTIACRAPFIRILNYHSDGTYIMTSNDHREMEYQTSCNLCFIIQQLDDVYVFFTMSK